MKAVENTPDDPRQRKPDITKAEELMGWEPKVTTASHGGGFPAEAWRREEGIKTPIITHFAGNMELEVLIWDYICSLHLLQILRLKTFQNKLLIWLAGYMIVVLHNLFKVIKCNRRLIGDCKIFPVQRH